MIRKFNLMSNLIILIKCGVGWCGSESVKQNRQTVHPSKVESALFRAFQSDSVIGSRIRPNKTKIGKNFRNNWRQENDSVPMIDQWLSAWPAEKPVSGEKKRLRNNLFLLCCVDAVSAWRVIQFLFHSRWQFACKCAELSMYK